MKPTSVPRACLALVAAFAAVVACSSSSSSSGGTADCTSLCTAGQQGNCTSIKGNCANFCAALAVVYPEANCTSQYNAYESCLGSPATECNNQCGSQQGALTNCVTPYCAAHTSDANCQTLAGSF